MLRELVLRELVLRELVLRELVLRELVLRELVLRELVLRDMQQRELRDRVVPVVAPRGVFPVVPYSGLIAAVSVASVPRASGVRRLANAAVSREASV